MGDFDGTDSLGIVGQLGFEFLIVNHRFGQWTCSAISQASAPPMAPNPPTWKILPVLRLAPRNEGRLDDILTTRLNPR